MTSFNEVFESVKQYILQAELITSVGYNSWIKGLTAVELENGNTAVLGINHEFARDIVERNYTDILEKGFSDVMGFPISVKIVVQEDMLGEMYAAENRTNEMKNIFEGAKYEYTFDTFIVGRSNEFAYAACTAVAGVQQTPKNSSEHSIYNPLFIYGPSGLGKTHLLTAIAHEFNKNFPGSNIIYVTGEAFT
ncbi:MAG: chromosomal replication initiator protein DnaA, partial [Oscillospiraceae bacterium]|nr:chromosomal replication initiator protein DnaA [Oscillospiraceae bacterium]